METVTPIGFRPDEIPDDQILLPAIEPDNWSGPSTRCDPPPDPAPTASARVRGKRHRRLGPPPGSEPTGSAVHTGAVATPRPTARRLLIGAVWLVLLLLLLLGLRQVIAPRSAPDVGQIAGQVAQVIGHSGFPRETGEAAATAFASAYLTGGPDASRNLAEWTPGQDTTGWVTGSGPQSVLTAPVVAGWVSPAPDRAVATVAARVGPEPGTRVHLAVPLTADKAGRVTVSGPPSFVPDPGRAQVTALAPATPLDPTVAANLIPTLNGFVDAWAAGDRQALARYLTPDAGAVEQAGLPGMVTRTGDVSGLRTLAGVAAAGTSTGPVLFDVQWTDRAGGRMRQSYEVQLVRGDAGREFVARIGPAPGVVGADSGSSPTVAATGSASEQVGSTTP